MKPSDRHISDCVESTKLLKKWKNKSINSKEKIRLKFILTRSSKYKYRHGDKWGSLMIIGILGQIEK